MTLELTSETKLALAQQNITQNIILEIEGFSEVFGALPISKTLRYDDPDLFYDDPGLFYDQPVEDPNSRPYIMIGQGSKTTKNISQQLELDKGGTSSVTNFIVQLVDKDNELSRIFAPGATVPDVLGSEARVYVNVGNLAHKENSIQIFSGVISNLDFPSGGTCVLRISSPEELKRQELFIKANTDLTSTIDDTVTTIPATSTENFYTSVDAATSHIRIEDEVMEVVSKGASSFTVVRGALGTIAASHNSGESIESLIQLSDDTIDLALKLLLSGDNTNWITGVDVESFYRQSATLTIDNAIFFNEADIEKRLGLTVGDFISISGSASNNFTDRTIQAFGKNDLGSWIIVDGAALVEELDSSGTMASKSRYAVLNDGCNLTPRFVDVKRFNEIIELVPNETLDQDFRLEDGITAADFINEKLLYPAGFFSLFRNGKISLGKTLPPIADTEPIILTKDNVKDPDKIQIKRSVNTNFYNSTVYRFEKDVIKDKFTRGEVVLDEDSTNRIGGGRLGTKPLTIEADGFRDTGDTTLFIQRQAANFLDRFKFAAQFLEIEVLYGLGLPVELGDTVILDGEDLNLHNFNTGTRSFDARIFEVINLKKDLVKGRVQLTLLDIGFGINGRFAKIAPSSKIASGSTTTVINLKRSFGTTDFENEADKYIGLEGERVIIRSSDYTVSEESTIKSISTTVENQIELETALSFSPLEDYFLDIAPYSELNDTNIDKRSKVRFGYTNASLEVASGASDTVFDLIGADTPDLQVGAEITVHNDDYSLLSPEVTVIDITGDTVTVDASLGFTPAAGYLVELGLYPDGGLPYRYV